MTGLADDVRYLTAYSTTGGVTFSLSNTTVDGLGRLIEADETPTKPNSSTISHSHDYAYDMRSQLLSADITNIGGSTWSADYNYRKDGNIDDETVAGSSADFEYDGDLMAEKRITSRDVLESTTRDTDSDTQTDMEGIADDKTVVVDDQFSGTVDKDDDTDVLVYQFSKDFPEIKKHAEAYEAEIAKLIANQDIDTETVLVEYRDI